MHLTEDLREMLPSDQDVQFYRDHGWWVAPVVLSEEIIDEARRGAERHWRGETDWELPISGGFKDWRPGDPETLRVGEIIALRNRQIRQLAEQPVIGAIAARLTGSQQIRLWESELIQKPPQVDVPNATVGWHTDRAYWMTCTSVDMLTAWIPFHDCPEEMGPLMVFDGSNAWPEVDHDTLRQFQNPDVAGLGQRLAQDREKPRIQSMALRKGQVSFHSALTLHASGVNTSNRSRVSLALHLQDGDNRYREYYNEAGELWQVVADRLCRTGPDGRPDYADPAICPVFWEEGEAR
jgi:hypothetical protein